MSIDDELRELQTVTEGDRALQLFTDRYELTRLFAEYLNEESPRNTILFFHGDGGNGKSLLLKFLRQRCCKRFLPGTWQQVQAIPKAEVARVAAYIEKAKPGEGCIPVPAVVLDFSQTPIGEDQPQHPFYGLLMLRRNLAEAFAGLPYRLRFPLYDFACVWYFYKTGNLEQAKELLPSDEMDVITGIVDAVSDTSYASIAKAVLGVFGKHLGAKFKLSLQKRGLKEEDIKVIQGMEPQTELIDELPRLFAKDLNAAMAQQEELKRIVLFFDAHEAFWGHQRDLREEVLFQRDEWLRCFLRALDLDAGIVAVVAGREKPRWAEATRSAIPQQYLDTLLVGHFSPTDARDYLQKADIKDAALQQSLIDYASVDADEVHPFYLGLCADVVLAARAQGKFLTPEDFPTAPETPDKSRALINRLLKYVAKEVEAAVHALSACRAFDFELYLKLGQALHFHATHPAFFDILTRFSFVWQAQRRGENWYRIHDLLRRLDDESGNEITRRAHEVLEQHYREQGEVAEAIYHANRLDWKRGVKEWYQVFDQAFCQSRYELCRTLLEVRRDLLIQDDLELGDISAREGNYLVRLAHHAEAQQEYLEAISAYERTLNQVPNLVEALNNKGDVLRSLGDLQSQIAQHTEAFASYQRALTVCEQVFAIDPNSVTALHNKGNVLKSIGDLQTLLRIWDKALISYEQAILTYDKALQIDQDDVIALNNKGLALKELGYLQTRCDKPSEALQSYQQAINIYTRILTIAPDDVYALNNKGLALRELGELQDVYLDQYSEALQSYHQALDVYNQVLTLASDDMEVFNNKGVVLHRLGLLQTTLNGHTDALLSYQQSIAAYNQALSFAPQYILALKNKGFALQDLGELQTQLNEHSKALSSYQAAIETFNQALDLAPNYIDALNGKGYTLKNLGDLQEELSQVQAAVKSWQAALIVLTRSLEIAPDNEEICELRDQLQEYLDNFDGDTSSN